LLAKNKIAINYLFLVVPGYISGTPNKTPFAKAFKGIKLKVCKTASNPHSPEALS
jgi:hypothetical protein